MPDQPQELVSQPSSRPWGYIDGANLWAGIARVLSRDGNLAVALLARRAEPLNDLVKSLKTQSPGAVIEAFPTVRWFQG